MIPIVRRSFPYWSRNNEKVRSMSFAPFFVEEEYE